MSMCMSNMAAHQMFQSLAYPAAVASASVADHALLQRCS